MRTFITGGAGFIGSHLADALIARGDSVTILDNMSTGSAKNIAHLQGKIEVHAGDIRDKALVEKLVEQSDIVFHMAAALGVKNIMEHTLESIDRNFNGSEIVLHAATKFNKRLIIASTSEIYGKNPNQPLNEESDRVVGAPQKIRWTYSDAEYLGFLSLVAHEYFHLWNVKRIRPIELGPFNYDEENYTSLLWVMEGFTTYYDELLLLRAGYTDDTDYLQKLQSTVNYVEGSVGARVQPLAHASFDAWIKAYRPNENSSNTTMTYYSRGQMLAALIDVMIISKYDGKKCLDHFLQQLYNKYYKKLNRGFSEQEFKTELEEMLGENLDVFFAKYVNGTDIAPLSETFAKVGVQVTEIGLPRASFGAGLRQDGGKTIVRSIRAGSAAELAGLSVNDELIGCNGYRVDQTDFEQFVNGVENGAQFKILVSRDDILYELSVKMTMYDRPQYQFKVVEDDAKAKLRKYWLRKTV